MQRSLALLSLAFVITACGTEGNSGSKAASILPDAPAAEVARVLVPLTATLGNVTLQSAQGPAVGLWTEIKVELMVPCTQNLESFSTSYLRDADGNVTVLASAYASAAPSHQGGMVCQAFSNHTEVVSIAGIVAADQVTLVNLPAQGSPIPAGTVSIAPVAEATVVSTRSLCPEGVFCILGGTIVTVAFPINSCVNDLAPVAYHVTVNTATNGITLAVNALEFTNEAASRVRCATPQFVTREISLPLFFATKDTIELLVLN